MQKRVMKYMTSIGQKTGILKKSKNVQKNAMRVDLVTEYQNLNSGSRRTNGRNSSLARVGNSGPPSSERNDKHFDEANINLKIIIIRVLAYVRNIKKQTRICQLNFTY